MIHHFAPRHFASFVLSAALFTVIGCKPAAAPNTNQIQPLDDPSVQRTSGTVRQPSASDLASFLRSIVPPTSKVVEVKSDPAVPLHNVVPGTNAWLLSVRMTLAPAEDLFLPAPAKDTQALQAMLDELKSLADWSQAYADSPYTDLGASFTVKVPASTAPQLLNIAHPRGQPLAPIYGKVAAEWQVDHWQFSVLSLPKYGDGGSEPRSWFQGATLVQGSREASHYLGETRAALSDAKEKRAAIERRYQEALAQATRPGTVYHGELRLLSTSQVNPVPVEVRFVDVTLGGPVTHEAQFTLKLAQPPTGHDYAFRVKLADYLPLVPPGQTHRAVGYQAASLGDASIDFQQTTGKEDNSMSLEGLLFRAMHSGLNAGNLRLLVHNRRLEGWVASGYYGQLLISAGQAP